jgi:hypothetical protein
MHDYEFGVLYRFVKYTGPDRSGALWNSPCLLPPYPLSLRQKVRLPSVGHRSLKGALLAINVLGGLFDDID